MSKEDFTRILAESNAPENKEGVKTDAEKLAKEEGLFGMPWIIMEKEDGTKESFFGSDRMMSIAWWSVAPLLLVVQLGLMLHAGWARKNIPMMGRLQASVLETTRRRASCRSWVTLRQPGDNPGATHQQYA